MMGKTVRITGLFCYPVKGLGGIALDHCEVGTEGLAWDRRWMLVDSAGRFITQRQLPAMAAIRSVLSTHELQLIAPNGRRLSIPLTPPEGDMVETHVHGKRCFGIDEGAEASAWLEHVFADQWQHGMRLLRFAHDSLDHDELKRRVGESRFTEQGHGEVEAYTGFADGYPLLITSVSTLSAVNHELEVQSSSVVEMSRFRPNIVIEGLSSFAEHDLEILSQPKKGIRLWACKPCERCPVTKVDQVSGDVMDPREPLDVLKRIGPFGNSAIFGVNAVVLKGQGAQIAVGDELKLERFS